MKLGLGSYACAWSIGIPGSEPSVTLSAGDFIRLAASLGVSLVQIADNIPLQRYTAEEIQTLRAVARDHGVEVELGTRGVRPDRLRQFLALCRVFEASLLRVVPDRADDIAGALHAMLPEIEDAGVTVAIENHDSLGVEILADIVERIDSKQIGVCLDTVNSFGALQGPDVVIGILAPYVVNLHVKDFVIERHPSMLGFEITGAPAGQGRLDIPGLLAALRAHGRGPNAILELWPSPEASVEQTVAKERRWIVESVDYLNRALSSPRP